MLSDFSTKPNWTAAHARIRDEELGQAQLGEFALRSTDNGFSWSRPIATIVNSPHGPASR